VIEAASSDDAGRAATEATSAWSPIIVVPTLNNARTISGVLDGLAAYGVPIIVVDDGCTDDTPTLLTAWRSRHPYVDLQVETHATNRGKGCALLTGFRVAHERGATHAVTIDSDGQHDPGDVGDLLETAHAHPRALVLGCRALHIPGCPRRCLVGRSVANTLVLIQSLVRLTDTQCGLRVYPLGLVRLITWRSSRFSLETEVVVRAAWAGCEIVEWPVSCVYDVPGGRVSHWRPWRDTLRDAALHLRLFGRSLLPIPHQLWPDEDDEVGAAMRQARRVRAWISPARLLRDLRECRAGGSSMAPSLGVGAFVACSPFYGLHAGISLYLAWRLRLHPLPAVVGSFLSTPPIGVFIVAASIQVGHVLLTGRVLGWPSGVGEASWWQLSSTVLLAWLLGSVVVGSVVAMVTYFLASRMERLVRRDSSVGKARHELA
jgi:uncharacterized protein (DUF2062 family)